MLLILFRFVFTNIVDIYFIYLYLLLNFYLIWLHNYWVIILLCLLLCYWQLPLKLLLYWYLKVFVCIFILLLWLVIILILKLIILLISHLLIFINLRLGYISLSYHNFLLLNLFSLSLFFLYSLFSLFYRQC